MVWRLLMKIEHCRKVNNSMYELILSDGRKLNLYDDVILKYELLLKRDIDDTLLEAVMNENKYFDFYYLSLKYIKARRRSTKEVYDKLFDSGCTKSQLFDILNKLISQGYLNDADYANSFCHEQIITTSRGPLKIKMELLKKGIEATIAEEAMQQYTDDIQREKVEKIISKMIKSNRTRSSIELEKKIVNDLLSKGFSKEIVLDVYNEYDVSDDSDIREKEYQKLYKKLSRKYSGKELELKIKEKMYQKGFKV